MEEKKEEKPKPDKLETLVYGNRTAPLIYVALCIIRRAKHAKGDQFFSVSYRELRNVTKLKHNNSIYPALGALEFANWIERKHTYYKDKKTEKPRARLEVSLRFRLA